MPILVKPSGCLAGSIFIFCWLSRVFRRVWSNSWVKSGEKSPQFSAERSRNPGCFTRGPWSRSSFTALIFCTHVTADSSPAANLGIPWIPWIPWMLRLQNPRKSLGKSHGTSAFLEEFYGTSHGISSFREELFLDISQYLGSLRSFNPAKLPPRGTHGTPQASDDLMGSIAGNPSPINRRGLPHVPGLVQLRVCYWKYGPWK